MKQVIKFSVIIAALAGSALAGNVTINPTAVHGAPLQVTASFLSAQVSFNSTGVGMALAQQGNLLTRTVNTPQSELVGVWSFVLSHTAGIGYSLSISSDPGTRTEKIKLGWPGTSSSSTVGLATGDDGNSLPLTEAPNAGTPSFAIANFIRVRARAIGSGEALTFSDFAFAGAPTTGQFNDGTVTAVSGLRNSIDGSQASGSNYQDVLSGSDLTQSSWMLSGRLRSGSSSSSDTIGLDIDVLGGANPVTVVPLPTGAACGLVGLASLAFRRRARRAV